MQELDVPLLHPPGLSLRRKRTVRRGGSPRQGPPRRLQPIRTALVLGGIDLCITRTKAPADGEGRATPAVENGPLLPTCNAVSSEARGSCLFVHARGPGHGGTPVLQPSVSHAAPTAIRASYLRLEGVLLTPSTLLPSVVFTTSESPTLPLRNRRIPVGAPGAPDADIVVALPPQSGETHQAQRPQQTRVIAVLADLHPAVDDLTLFALGLGYIAGHRQHASAQEGGKRRSGHLLPGEVPCAR